MKNALLKETFREIRRSKNRFFSILAIIAVGCGFFAGVKSSCPDMKLTAERYFAEQQMYDLRLISTYGFNEDDLEAIRQDGDIRGMMPAYSADVLVAEGDASELTVRVLSCPTGEGEDQLNQSVLKEGRMPEKSGECVLGTNSLSSPLWELGAKVQLTSGTGDPLSDTLSAEEYEVVGYVQTPQFLSVTLGNTSVGDGKLDGYIFVPGEDFCLEVYTDVYLTLQSTDGLDPFTDAYTDAVDAAAKRFESVADVRTVERFEEIQTDAREELDDAKQQLADGEAELADGEAELADAREELDKGWADYNEAKEEFDSQIADAERRLADAERQLADGEAEYQSGLKEYEDGLAAYEAARPDAEAQLEVYRAQAAELEAQLGEAAASMESGRQLLSGIDGILTGFAETSVPASMVPQEVQAVIGGSAGLHENLPALLTAYVTGSAREKAGAKAGIEAITGPAAVMLNESQAQYDEGVQGLAALKQGIADGEQQLADGKAGLDAAKEQLDAAREKLDRGRTELSQNRRAFEDEKADGEQQLSDALAELEDGEAEYADGKAEFDEKYPDAVADIADAKEKIADGEAELADLEEPVWYVQTREDNSGCSSYGDDAEKVDAVAAVFPIFFVLVAALVCLTAMTRMVEEQRTQIGTLKALGYGRGAVMSKYILYAVTASVVGSVLGLLIGFQLFPRVIINAYKSLYQLPRPLTPFRWDYAAACMLVSVLCTGLSALAASYRAMSAFPARLMRPKSPKAGKRILLERIGFIWNRLNFTRKVTMRNIFRYKKRVLMTVVGVAGCTALMLAGFGLHHAVTSIAPKQYGDVFVYSATAATDGSAQRQQELCEFIRSQPGVTGVAQVREKSVTASFDGKQYDCTAFAPLEPDTLPDFVHLQERSSGTPLSLTDGGVIIDEKLSRLTGLSAGAELTLQISDSRVVSVPITGIMENYVMHYVYMTPSLYESLFEEECTANTLLFNMEEGADRSAVSTAVLAQDDVLAVLLTGDYSDAFTKLTGSMSLIVWVLIISAGALAIIVMYNLISINVSERTRELATIKVLGFHDREVSSYICRENTLASVGGLLLGLLLGVLLEKFVVNIAEVDVVMFAHDIPLSCFVYSAALTLLFTWLVNTVVHFSLKKISMVESMKAVE